MAKYTLKDFKSDQEVRWCPGCGDYAILAALQKTFPTVCEEKGIDKKRAFFSGLCMEEMAGNIVTHGFSKDSKKHSVDIRVIHKGDEIILRLRDNCKAFDPAIRTKIMEQGDEGKNVGIRLVYSIAKDVSYQNLLGMNVLTIRM